MKRKVDDKISVMDNFLKNKKFVKKDVVRKKSQISFQISKN